MNEKQRNARLAVLLNMPIAQANPTVGELTHASYHESSEQEHQPAEGMSG